MERRSLVRRSITGLPALSLLVLAQPAAAHPTQSFRACTAHTTGPCTERGAAFSFGDVVLVRGAVVPAHAGRVARVLRQDPHTKVWTRVGEVTVSDMGTMRLRWRTHRPDAVQDAPYLFRFTIPGHGRSNATEAFVLFGE